MKVKVGVVGFSFGVDFTSLFNKHPDVEKICVADLKPELAKIEGLNITASGGVSSIEELKELQRMGTHAAILGKALYTGKLDLQRAVALVQKERTL